MSERSIPAQGEADEPNSQIASMPLGRSEIQELRQALALLRTLHPGLKIDGEKPDTLASKASRSQSGGMNDGERLAKIEGQVDTLKVVRPLTITVVSVVLAALVFVIGFLSVQVQATNTKVDAVSAKLGAQIDAIPQRLTEEFRAMRAETAAQTSAIASSITAARQVQPQIIILPPTPPVAPTQPRP